MPNPDTTGAPGIGHLNAGAPAGGGMLAGFVVVVAALAVVTGFVVGVPGLTVGVVFFAVVVVILGFVVVVFGFVVVVVVAALARSSAAIWADSRWRSSIWLW
jgi:hypothetical protein